VKRNKWSGSAKFDFLSMLQFIKCMAPKKVILVITAATLMNALLSIYIYEHLIVHSWNSDPICLKEQMNFNKRLDSSILWDWIY
jgi:hypothetical protein